MDGWKDGLKDGRIDGWMDGLKAPMRLSPVGNRGVKVSIDRYTCIRFIVDKISCKPLRSVDKVWDG